MRRSMLTGAVAFALVAAAASTALAGAWSVPSGPAQDFWYYNGQDVNGRFGNPEIYGNTFTFPLTTFQANASAGGYDEDGDTVSWDIHCNPGYTLDYVTVWAFGSYAMTGVVSTVDAEMAITVREINDPLRTWTDPLTSDPDFPLSTDATHPSLQGYWYGLSEMDLSAEVPAPGEWLHVEMATLLKAWASATGTAQINTQYQELSFEFHFIPEPGTLALLGLGVVALAWRRR